MTNAASSADVRSTLDQIIHDRGEDYAGLSRMIGRNPAYIQQFIRRGSPRHLSEQDRRLLADYLCVDESLLGAPPRPAVGTPVSVDGLFAVPRLDIGASAGAGSMGEADHMVARHAFDARWLRDLTSAPQRLAIIRVEGDSMAPTLGHGDDIMVDSSDAADRLRDGIYVLRRDDLLLVKRLILDIGGRPAAVHIISDNSIYPAERNVPVQDLAIVGRVVWAGRRIS